jgi:YidC/Oxa1 family membrane protein insertase
MADIFYALIIFPIVQVIDFSFVFVDRVFHNPGFAVIGVSVVITLCTLPLYLIAEHWQKIERDTVKRLKPKIDKIKAAFKGDEQYMILSVFYRQSHYHPVYAMRSTLGLLIQIPFFIAAYSYLSHLPDLRGCSFFFIADLGAGDGLLRFGGISINLLPVIMTLINAAAGIIYTWGFQARDKIQLYGMSLVFLLLLYNSPSGLVLYWTMNNIFSLIKHIVSKSKRLRPVGFILLCAGVLFMDMIVLFFLNVSIPKRIFFIALSSLVFLLPTIRIINSKFIRIIESPKKSPSSSAVYQNSTFIFSVIIVFLLAGLVIPGSVISSSTEEFSFIESYNSPFPFLLNTLVQSAGLFLFWPLWVYFLFSKRTKIYLTVIAALFVVLALVNTFIFPSYYGFLTITLIFSQPSVFNIGILSFLLNMLVFLALSAVALFLLFYRKKIIFQAFQIILLISLAGFGFLNIFTISGDYAKTAAARNSENYVKTIEPVYSFSMNKKNVLVIMLDAAVGGFVPYIFGENEEIAKGLTGFTWFPNCASYSSYTLLGAPPLFGGYEYTPLEINKRKNDLLRDKYNESLLLMPRVFLDAGYEVAATDIPYAESKIFEQYPEIKADNLIRKYSAHWLENHPEIRIVSISSLLRSNLIRLSYFKFLPPLLRIFFYDDGEWFTKLGMDGDGDAAVENRGKLTLTTIDSLSVLDLLPDLSTVKNDSPGTLTIMVSNLTHDPAFFEYPGYEAATRVTNFGDGPFSQNPQYHANMKAFLLLEKWFAFLKKNQVYDNTRIIIASDHGSWLSKTPGNVIGAYSAYNPLLMYKDFNSRNSLNTDETFMTNADTSLLAMKDIIANPVNPFTGKSLTDHKKDGITISTMRLTDFNDHSRYTYKITNNAWLHVKDNIFEPANWERVSISE